VFDLSLLIKLILLAIIFGEFSFYVATRQVVNVWEFLLACKLASLSLHWVPRADIPRVSTGTGHKFVQPSSSLSFSPRSLSSLTFSFRFFWFSVLQTRAESET